jgi:hypothetical protein
LAHCTYPAPPEDPVRREAGRAFADSIRDRGIKQQLLLGGKKILNEVLRQTLRLIIVKLAVKSSVRLRTVSDRALWRS